MKSKKRIGIIASLVLAFGVFAVGGVGLAISNKVSAASIENLYVLDEYTANKVFTIPTAQLKVGDSIVDSEYGYLVFPSGKATDKSPVTLTEEGVYELVYTATVDGKKVKATKNFTVKKEIYKVNDEKSSVYYGIDPSLPNIEGIVLNLANRDEFVYDEIIDLSDNTEKDVLIKFSMSPASVGSADVSQIVIRFTDIYDENNYFNIYVKNVADAGDWALRQVYICGGGNNQGAGGWERAPSGHNFHYNNTYGFPASFTMAGVPANSTKGYDELSLYYNAKDKTIHASNAIYPGGSMVTDLDDRDCYMNLWNGFSTGKVRMSITGVDYKTETMNAIITEIDGEKPKQVITTDVAPIIEVETFETTPYALVGTEYPIFKARAFDFHDGEKDIKTNVYYNYGKENQTVCNIINGKFIPKKTGTYTIVYSAIDNAAKSTVETVNVEAFDHAGLTVNVNGAKEKGYTGKETVLFDDIAISNESGEVSYSVTVNGQEILPRQGKYYFFPLEDGTYNVVVKVSDYIKTVDYSYEFKALKNLAPQIFDEILLPKYLIQGEEIKLPEISGYDFSSGKGKEHLTKIFVKENGGEEKAIDGNLYTPSESGTVEVIYRLDVDGKKVEKKATTNCVSVFEGEDLRLEKYFKTLSGDLVATATDNYISFVANKKSSVEFINKVQVKDFYMTFVVGENKSAFNRINIYLTDTVDSTKQVKFSYHKNMDGSATFSVNDGAKMSVDASFTNDSKNFMLTYSNGTVYGSVSVYSAVTEYLNGSAFEGFSGNFAYLTIEMDGVLGASEICLKNLNRQSLNDSNKDKTAPQILINAVSGERTLNDVIVLKDGFAADVLSNNWEFTMKVTAPDGSYVVTTDGVKMDGTTDPTGEYEIKLSSYGDYYIEYYAKDRAGKDKLLAFYITVKDSVAPEVKLGSQKTTAKVGETVTVATLTATDNVSENLTVFVCVENPDCQNDIVKDNKFVAEKAGEYIVKYMVWDEAGNYTFASYTITVK